MKFQHAEREYRGDPKPGDIVGAVISYGPEGARHHMLIKGDWTSCELRATQFEGGVARMVAVAEPDSTHVVP